MKVFTANQDYVMLSVHCPGSAHLPYFIPQKVGCKNKSANQERSNHNPLEESDRTTQNESCGTGLEDHRPKLKQDGSRLQWAVTKTIQLVGYLINSQLRRGSLWGYIHNRDLGKYPNTNISQ